MWTVFLVLTGLIGAPAIFIVWQMRKRRKSHLSALTYMAGTVGISDEQFVMTCGIEDREFASFSISVRRAIAENGGLRSEYVRPNDVINRGNVFPFWDDFDWHEYLSILENHCHGRFSTADVLALDSWFTKRDKTTVRDLILFSWRLIRRKHVSSSVSYDTVEL